MTDRGRSTSCRDCGGPIRGATTFHRPGCDAGRVPSPLDDLVLTLSANSEPFRLAMERAVRSVCHFADALNRVPGGWEALRRSERRYAVHQRRVGIALRQRDRRRARRERRLNRG